MEKIIDMYEKYLNDFVTVEKFSEWYGLDEDDAHIIIDMGRKYRERKSRILSRNIS